MSIGGGLSRKDDPAQAAAQAPLIEIPEDAASARHGAGQRRFIINVGSNLGYVAITTVLMLWYVPFLVHHLGVSAYGMISLANSLAMFAAIISSSLDVSINRFLAIDMNRRDFAAANRTFNTSLALSTIMILVLLTPIAIITYLLPTLFSVPAELAVPTQALFVSVAATLLMAMVGSNFGVASLIMHRFDLRNVARSAVMLSRVGVVALCFVAWSPSLWHVVAGFFVAAAVGLLGDVLIWRRLTPQLSIDFRNVDRGRLRAIFSLSQWSAINAGGTFLLTQVGLLVVNAEFGAEMTGRYGSLMLFPILIDTMASTVATVLSPMILARYAVGDLDGMRAIASRSVRLLGIGLALPIGLLCGFSRPLLVLWLGPGFAQSDVLLVLLVGHFAMLSSIQPLCYVLTAYNKVKPQALLTLAFGAANLVLALLVARWTGSATGVAAAAAIVWTIKNVGILSSYGAATMGMRWWAFYAPVLCSGLYTLAVGLSSVCVAQLWWPQSWLDLIVLSGAIALVYCAVVYALSLDRTDRQWLWSLFRRRSDA